MIDDLLTPVPPELVTNQDIAERIAEFGHVIVAVPAGEDTLPFLYSIGRTAAGRPELVLLLGNDAELLPGAELLHELVEREIPPGQSVRCSRTGQVFLTGGLPAGMDPLLRSAGVGGKAEAFYGRSVDLLYLVPDLASTRVH